ncbi:MAG TPA: hypothetical protein VK590_15955 [Saprospiraceae bacterium]|nr:hypothetical protein [Saprospiraceae bacterium]
MSHKSKKFLAASFIAFQIFLTTNSFAQHILELSDIKESLIQISHDAKDTMAKYKDKAVVNYMDHSTFINAKNADSLSIIYLRQDSIDRIYKRLMISLNILKPSTISRLSKKSLKSWMASQITYFILNDNKFVNEDYPENSLKSVLFYKNIVTQLSKFNKELYKQFVNLKEKTKNDPLKLLWSTPANGEFNFCPNCYLGILGYNRIDKIKNNKNSGVLMIKWHGLNIGPICSIATIDSVSGLIHFAVPMGFLNRGGVHKIELVKVEIPEELQDFWNSRIRSKKGLYTFYVGPFYFELCKYSEPITTVYFRVSKYQNLSQKIEDIPFVYDSINNKLNLGPIMEPFDSMEIFGSSLLQASLSFKCAKNESNLYKLIFKSSVSNYFYIPRNTNAPIENYKELTPFEMAGLINQPDIYKIQEGSFIRRESMWPKAVNKFMNGYTFDFTDTSTTHFILKGKLAPTITAKDYNIDKEFNIDPQTIEISSDFEDINRKNYEEVRQALNHRLMVKANLFYNIEMRDCKRTGRICNSTLDDFIKMERTNLPKSVADIINTPYAPGPLKSKDKLYSVNYGRPFSNPIQEYQIKVK